MVGSVHSAVQKSLDPIGIKACQGSGRNDRNNGVGGGSLTNLLPGAFEASSKIV